MCTREVLIGLPLDGLQHVLNARHQNTLSKVLYSARNSDAYFIQAPEIRAKDPEVLELAGPTAINPQHRGIDDQKKFRITCFFIECLLK